MSMLIPAYIEAAEKTYLMLAAEYSPFYAIEKGAVLQEARCFNDPHIDSRRCQQVHTHILDLDIPSVSSLILLRGVLQWLLMNPELIFLPCERRSSQSCYTSLRRERH